MQHAHTAALPRIQFLKALNGMSFRSSYSESGRSVCAFTCSIIRMSSSDVAGFEQTSLTDRARIISISRGCGVPVSTITIGPASPKYSNIRLTKKKRVFISLYTKEKLFYNARFYPFKLEGVKFDRRFMDK